MKNNKFLSHNEENLDNEIETSRSMAASAESWSVTTRRISITRLKRGPKGPGLIRNDSHNEENLDNEIETKRTWNKNEIYQICHNEENLDNEIETL